MNVVLFKGRTLIAEVIFSATQEGGCKEDILKFAETLRKIASGPKLRMILLMRDQNIFPSYKIWINTDEEELEVKTRIEKELNPLSIKIRLANAGDNVVELWNKVFKAAN